MNTSNIHRTVQFHAHIQLPTADILIFTNLLSMLAISWCNGNFWFVKEVSHSRPQSHLVKDKLKQDMNARFCFCLSSNKQRILGVGAWHGGWDTSWDVHIPDPSTWIWIFLLPIPDFVMYTLGGSRWWPNYLGLWHPYRRSELSSWIPGSRL